MNADALSKEERQKKIEIRNTLIVSLGLTGDESEATKRGRVGVRNSVRTTPGQPGGLGVHPGTKKHAQAVAGVGQRPRSRTKPASRRSVQSPGCFSQTVQRAVDAGPTMKSSRGRSGIGGLTLLGAEPIVLGNKNNARAGVVYTPPLSSSPSAIVPQLRQTMLREGGELAAMLRDSGGSGRWHEVSSPPSSMIWASDSPKSG